MTGGNEVSVHSFFVYQSSMHKSMSGHLRKAIDYLSIRFLVTLNEIFLVRSDGKGVACVKNDVNNVVLSSLSEKCGHRI